MTFEDAVTFLQENLEFFIEPILNAGAFNRWAAAQPSMQRFSDGLKKALKVDTYEHILEQKFDENCKPVPSLFYQFVTVLLYNQDTVNSKDTNILASRKEKVKELLQRTPALLAFIKKNENSSVIRKWYDDRDHNNNKLTALMNRELATFALHGKISRLTNRELDKFKKHTLFSPVQSSSVPAETTLAPDAFKMQ